MSSALYRRSVAMIIGDVLLSLLGIGMRIMDEPDNLKIIFYRPIAQCLFLTLVLMLTHRSLPVSGVETCLLRF